jgi:preprotein translocase subunit SecY
MKLLEAFTNVFRVPDLRKRLLFALALLAVYRLGGHIPTPGIDTNKLEQFFQQNQGTLFGYLDVFSGGSFRRLTIFALGIMPYITSSIILQLLTVVVPTLERLQKEGELGRRKITQWTRYLTVILALIQSFGIAMALQGAQQGFVTTPGVGFVLMTVLSLTTGTAFIMWLGEQITERGIGNGMSLIIFTGIVVGLPAAILEMWTKVSSGDWNALQVIIILVMMIAVVGFIVLVERRAPDSGAVCQARDRTAHDGRTVDAPSPEGERRRRDSGDLRQFPARVPADAGYRAVRQGLAGAQRHAGRDGRFDAALLFAVHRADHVLLLLLRFDYF